LFSSARSSFATPKSRICDLECDADGLVLGERSTRADAIGQLATLELLHREEGHVVGLAEIEDVDDPGMPDVGGEPRFLHETSDGLGVGAKLFAQELDGDDATELEMASLVDPAHAAAAEHTLDAVSTGDERASRELGCKLVHFRAGTVTPAWRWAHAAGARDHARKTVPVSRRE
jgi:hypothetical protein